MEILEIIKYLKLNRNSEIFKIKPSESNQTKKTLEPNLIEIWFGSVRKFGSNEIVQFGMKNEYF